jgi:hypothetical protein
MKDGSDPAFSRGDRDIGPIHVGIIMDGNGRWAAQRGLPRIEGHRRGVEALRQAVRAAPDFSIRYLTLYSFSTENWTRPPQEVSDVKALLKRFIRNDLAELHSHNVRVKVIGLRPRERQILPNRGEGGATGRTAAGSGTSALSEGIRAPAAEHIPTLPMTSTSRPAFILLQDGRKASARNDGARASRPKGSCPFFPRLCNFTNTRHSGR